MIIIPNIYKHLPMPDTWFWQLTIARQCSKHLTSVSSHKLWEVVLWWVPFNRFEHWRSGRLNNLPKVQWLGMMRGRNGVSSTYIFYNNITSKISVTHGKDLLYSFSPDSLHFKLFVKSMLFYAWWVFTNMYRCNHYPKSRSRTSPL